MKINFKSIFKYLIVKENVAGISFSDDSLHFLLFAPDNDSKIVASYEADIPQGVIVDGEIKKPELLKPILEGLRNSDNLKKIKHLYSVVSLRSNVVYHKIFNLPQVQPKEMPNAIELNMKMLSPIKYEEAYSDWELSSEPGEVSQFQYRVMSVFGKKSLIDSYNNLLTECGFLPLAVEFQALSIWRLFKHFGMIKDDKKSYLNILLTSDGMDFAVLKDTGLQFSYFQTWQGAIQTSPVLAPEMSRGVMNKESFLRIFTEELRKVFNFYLNRFQEGVSEVFLFAPFFGEDLTAVIEKEFHLPISKDIPKFSYSPAFFGTAGAAIRGLVSRADDVEVSLMSIGTEEEYRRRRILSFINLWSKVSMVTVFILIVTAIGVNLFLGMTEKSLQSTNNNLSVALNETKMTELENEARAFNSAISQAQAVLGITKEWSGFFNLWHDYGPEIKIQKMIISKIDSPVSFSGWVNTNAKMVEFRDKLITATNYFSEVDIPLKSIIQDKNGVEFNLTFKINKLP